MLTEVEIRRPATRVGTTWVLPWALALFFAAWSLHNLGSTGVVDTDAARHAMNGAFIHDMVAGGRLADPIGFGRAYYGRLPALSMPYHPPLFPVVESVAYSLFGVNLTAARLVVSFSVLAAALLFFGVVAAATGSRVAAACSVLVFFGWRISGAVAQDVMLEFPSFALMAAALWLIRDTGRPLSTVRWLAFGLLAGAAVWTKQHALFLGAVPVLALAFQGRFRSLLSARLWLALVVFSAACLALAALSLPFKATGVDQLVYEVDRAYFRDVVLHNLFFYLRAFPRLAGPVVLGAMLLAAALLPFLRSQVRGMALFAAWAAAGFTLLVLLGPYDERYLFYVYPATVAMTFAVLAKACRRWAPAWGRWAPAVPAALAAVLGLLSPAPFLRGPEQAAAAVVDGRPRRILYCGNADGNFVFAVRSLDPGLQTVVVSGEKLLDYPPRPERLAEVLVGYGISHAVLERTARAQPCNAVFGDAIAGAVLERRFEMRSSLARFDGGSISVYRLGQHTPAAPPQPLKIPVPKIGGAVDVGL